MLHVMQREQGGFGEGRGKRPLWAISGHLDGFLVNEAPGGALGPGGLSNRKARRTGPGGGTPYGGGDVSFEPSDAAWGGAHLERQKVEGAGMAGAAPKFQDLCRGEGDAAGGRAEDRSPCALSEEMEAGAGGIADFVAEGHEAVEAAARHESPEESPALPQSVEELLARLRQAEGNQRLLARTARVQHSKIYLLGASLKTKTEQISCLSEEIRLLKDELKRQKEMNHSLQMFAASLYEGNGGPGGGHGQQAGGSNYGPFSASTPFGPPDIF